MPNSKKQTRIVKINKPFQHDMHNSKPIVTQDTCDLYHKLARAMEKYHQ